MSHGASFVFLAAVAQAASLASTASLAACATRTDTGVVETADPPPTAAPLAPPQATPPGATVPRADDAPPVGPAACPEQMVLVEGDYCTAVRQDCLQWVDPPANPFARCARFAPSVCAGARMHKRFCVDQDEYVPPGDSLPLGGASWADAQRVCRQQSKRLCKETEWEFACEGEQMLPYPTGYERDPDACNVDKGGLVDPVTGKLRDLRETPASLAQCTSPFGVRSMAGNVDEWVWRDRTEGRWRSALKGGWWMPARDRCRPATTSHDEHFRDVQTGVRCCAEASAG